jgi:hypothetical protein
VGREGNGDRRSAGISVVRDRGTLRRVRRTKIKELGTAQRAGRTPPAPHGRDPGSVRRPQHPAPSMWALDAGGPDSTVAARGVPGLR